ncbi:hypothetical protein CLOP_g22880 [Closterium sp. NIES-67]|nr:hypothetical protein CLOP_g22880 [Closterium sp. NIES-67]
MPSDTVPCPSWPHDVIIIEAELSCAVALKLGSQACTSGGTQQLPGHGMRCSICRSSLTCRSGLTCRSSLTCRSGLTCRRED